MQLKQTVDLEELESIIDQEGFWYALTSGGYIKPVDILDSQADIDSVLGAISILQVFEASLPQV